MERTWVVKPQDFSKQDYRSFVLAADIGGTNARLAIVGVHNTINPILRHTYKTENFKEPALAINTLLEEAKQSYNIEVCVACLGVAGPVTRNRTYAEWTHQDLAIDTTQILPNTLLKTIILINDFEALGYSLNAIDTKKDTVTLHAAPRKEGPVLIMGPGTGLGCCTVLWNPVKKAWQPSPSEGGMIEAAARTKEEHAILAACDIPFPLYEDVVSGPGLVRIYEHLGKKKRAPSLKDSKDILQHAKKNTTARAALDHFLTFYGRAVKTNMLAVLPSQVYLVGDFSRDLEPYLKDAHGPFITELHAHLYKNLLRETSLSLITASDASILGAAEAATHWQELSMRP